MTTAHCSHLPACPGCPRFGAPGIAPRALDTLTQLAHANNLPAPRVMEGAALGYRHRARLAVRGRAHSPKLGIFRQGTHQIVDIPHCPIHHPLINDVARGVKAELKSMGVPPYSDDAHAGLIRYVQIVVERSSERAQLVVVTRSDEYLPNATLCERLWTQLSGRLQGLFWNGNPERHNAILGDHWQHVAGEATTVEQLGGARVFFPPGAFGQSHLALYDGVIEHVHEWAHGAEHVVELYAGTGGLGLGLATRGARVLFNELQPDSLQGLHLGIAALPEQARARVSVNAGKASDHAEMLCSSGAQLVIADPPRKGLDPGVLAALQKHRPARFIYLSCGLESFVRDTHALLAQAGYALTALQAYALFPFTEHVESLALFEARTA